MSLFAIAMTYLRSRLSLSLLHILLMALGVGMMTALLLFGHQLQERLYKDSAGIDAVVGAKGSPLQLILSSVQHMDVPTGNIPLSEVERLRHDRRVKQVIPLSLGDSFHQFRIVGTEHSYPALFQAELADGELWDHSMEAVIGAQVAKETGLKPGDRFSGSHGLAEGGHEHAGHPYLVTGVLKPTGRVVDRLILTSLESVWDIHDEHEEEAHEDEEEHAHHDHDEHEHHEEEHIDENAEVTALLISYRTRTAVLTFPRDINRNTALQAASPAFEMARLVDLIGIGSDTLMSIGGILVAVALAGVLIALFNAVRERRYDLALFRVFGASRRAIVTLVVLEGMTIAFIGSLCGLLAGYGGLWLIGNWTEKGMELGLAHPALLPQIFGLWALVLLISFLACLIPAWQVYRLNIRDMLIHGRE
jgi:putative ABC transport system permease protein